MIKEYIDGIVKEMDNDVNEFVNEEDAKGYIYIKYKGMDVNMVVNNCEVVVSIGEISVRVDKPKAEEV